MTDTERLAALLHEPCIEAQMGAPMSPGLAAIDTDWHNAEAARLVAAGVRVGEGCPSCGAPRSGCNDCGWKPEQPIVALAPIKQVELFEVSIVKDPPHPSWTIQRIDPDRLARALARRTDRTDAWVLLPKEMQDLWRKDAAAIVKAYEEEG